LLLNNNRYKNSILKLNLKIDFKLYIKFNKMRYLGNKKQIIKFIESKILNTLESNNIEIDSINKFYDLFSGSGTVSENFKDKFNVVGNDLLYSSFVMSKVKLFNEIPNKNNLLQLMDKIKTKKEEGFITNMYSEGSGRLFFKKQNGMLIDGIRNEIETLYLNHEISEDEFYYLLACLVESVHSISNTTGVYAAYLKKLNPNALKDLNFAPIELKGSTKEHQCFNVDCVELLPNIKENDIIYIDPPYNQRQYGTNYHLLEIIVKGEEPVIKIVRGGESVSGLIDNLPKSKWCSKKTILEELEKILSSKSKYIFMSYNNEGLISENDLKEIFEKYGNLTIEKSIHKKYKSNKNSNSKTVYELLFCLIKP